MTSEFPPYEFSGDSPEPLVEQTVSLFVLADSAVTFDGDLSKLSDRSFGLVNFSYGDLFDNFKKTLKTADGSMESPMNVEKLANRRFDIMPSDRWVAAYYFRQFRSEGTALRDAERRELRQDPGLLEEGARGLAPRAGRLPGNPG